MGEVTRLQQAVDSAEGAAEAGDFAAAEGYLREALAIQEADLGPAHPDLASTLNNLGVVCERLDKPAEAEQCYRRAYAIVASALRADDLSVATSRRNLEDFCAARNISTEVPKPTPPPSPAPAPTPAPLVDEPPRPPVAFALPVRRWTDRPVVLAGVGAIIGVVILGIWLSRPRHDDTSPTASPDRGAAPAASPAAPAAPQTVAPTPPHPAPQAPDTSRPVAAAKNPADRKSVTPVTVVEARLCSNLTNAGGAWTCSPPADPVRSGVIFFYTRVASAHEGIVLHRWYHDDRLQRSRELQIHANAASGYRTYSRYTLDSKSAGKWRVELRTPDGRLLHEEQFVVR